MSRSQQNCHHSSAFKKWWGHVVLKALISRMFGELFISFRKKICIQHISRCYFCILKGFLAYEKCQFCKQVPDFSYTWASCLKVWTHEIYKSKKDNYRKFSSSICSFFNLIRHNLNSTHNLNWTLSSQHATVNYTQKNCIVTTVCTI